MNKWIWLTTSVILLASAQSAARISYEEKKAQEHIKHIQERKQKEQEYARRIVRNTQLQTARKKDRRNKETERQKLAAQQKAQSKEKKPSIS